MKEASIIPKKNMISEKKKKDVSNLLKYFEVIKNANELYQDALQ